MEKTETPRTKTALQIKRETRLIKRRMRRDMNKGIKNHHIANGEEENDEKGEIEKKVIALKRIVPGGESLEIDKLFEQTAGYIMELKYQVKAMKVLACFFEGLDNKENMKLGG